MLMVPEVDLILPEEICMLVEEQIHGKIFSYARVYMSLQDIISGDFFSQYIKAGTSI
jgi:ribonuclease P/MRP protein subunit RPP40